MVSRKHGAIVGKRKTLYVFDGGAKNGEIQEAKYEDGTRAINIFNRLLPSSYRIGCIVIPLEYKAIQAILNGLFGLYGEEVVKAELEKAKRELENDKRNL